MDRPTSTKNSNDFLNLDLLGPPTLDSNNTPIWQDGLDGFTHQINTSLPTTVAPEDMILSQPEFQPTGSQSNSPLTDEDVRFFRDLGIDPFYSTSSSQDIDLNRLSPSTIAPSDIAPAKTITTAPVSPINLAAPSAILSGSTTRKLEFLKDKQPTLKEGDVMRVPGSLERSPAPYRLNERDRKQLEKYEKELEKRKKGFDYYGGEEAQGEMTMEKAKRIAKAQAEYREKVEEEKRKKAWEQHMAQWRSTATPSDAFLSTPPYLSGSPGCGDGSPTAIPAVSVSTPNSNVFSPAPAVSVTPGLASFPSHNSAIPYPFGPSISNIPGLAPPFQPSSSAIPYPPTSTVATSSHLPASSSIPLVINVPLQASTAGGSVAPTINEVQVPGFKVYTYNAQQRDWVPASTDTMRKVYRDTMKSGCLPGAMIVTRDADEKVMDVRYGAVPSAIAKSVGIELPEFRRRGDRSRVRRNREERTRRERRMEERNAKRRSRKEMKEEDSGSQEQPMLIETDNEHERVKMESDWSSGGSDSESSRPSDISLRSRSPTPHSRPKSESTGRRKRDRASQSTAPKLKMEST
ncbi:hypothetical protein BT69DRAFT_1346244 [Atractiella rhizophila]|nr:hypothetical protein BT69DRAFT_1346244 [Atractiella rhizophila]